MVFKQVENNLSLEPVQTNLWLTISPPHLQPEGYTSAPPSSFSLGSSSASLTIIILTNWRLLSSFHIIDALLKLKIASLAIRYNKGRVYPAIELELV